MTPGRNASASSVRPPKPSALWQLRQNGFRDESGRGAPERSGPSGKLIASRSDPELHRSVSSLRRKMARALQIEFADLFPVLAGVAEFRVIPDFSNDLREGMVVNGSVVEYPERQRRRRHTS